jgi:CrcB protein
MNFLFVFIGGGLGAITRYLIGIYWAQQNVWTSTLLSNLIAALIIGVLYGVLEPKASSSNILWLLLSVGFCGGLSTFSTFSLEIFQWIQQEKWLQCVVYIALNVVLCTALIFATFKLWGALK